MAAIIKPLADPNNLTLNSTEGQPPILLATDGSGYAGAAVDFAISQARHEGARLIITYFADPDDVSLFHGAPCHDNQAWREQGREVLSHIEERAKVAGVEDIEVILEDSQLSETLPELAARLGAGLIVLASHQFGE